MLRKLFVAFSLLLGSIYITLSRRHFEFCLLVRLQPKIPLALTVNINCASALALNGTEQRVFDLTILNRSGYPKILPFLDIISKQLYLKQATKVSGKYV
jgi:hypothetical protein